MNQKIKFLFLWLIMLLDLSAYAQEFYVSNNAEIKALASKAEITRIAFDFPVIEVHSLSEEIEYVINGKDIYLRMLNEDKPINFFVKCENENTYKLLLIAQDAPANQIFIHNKAASAKAISKTEYFADISPELKQRVAKIIEVTLNPTKHLNYRFENKNVNLFIHNKNLKAKLEILISGNQLIAEKVHLTNKLDQSIKLDLKDFADNKYLAVYLNTDKIQPKQNAVLIRVLEIK